MYDPEKSHEYYLKNKERILIRTKKYNLKNREACNRRARLWRKRNPWYAIEGSRKYNTEKSNQKNASNRLYRAVKSGRIQKSTCCADCGSRSKRIHGHHEDYSKPLEVVWLCPHCHAVRHQKEGVI